MVWARETAGLTLAEAAKKLGFQDSSKSTAAQKLEVLESGNKEPSRAQLAKMSDQYRRPLLTFYLSNPPAKADRGVDFRTFSADHSAKEEAALDALVREMRTRQSMLRDLLEGEEESEPLDFVGSLSLLEGQERALSGLKNLLGVDLSEYRRQRDAKAGFDLLRNKTEERGVFVVLQGNLGSYHSNIDLETFRGFSIADNIAPFVVINPYDARPALTFTLLHELVHILLGQSGVGASSVDNDIERFCDAVAGDFLLPAEDLEMLAVDRDLEFSVLAERISKFSQDFNLSRSMVALRASRVDLISRETCGELMSTFRKQWREDRERARARNAPINPNVTRKYYLGHHLRGTVSRALSTGDLSTVKAATVLGVRAGQVQEMVSMGR